jgi:uncharacterized membrane-anchored protein
MSKHIPISATLLVALGVVWVGSGAARAQDSESDAITWQTGPGSGQLGNVARIQIPEGYRFAGREGVRRFMELTENPVSGGELGVVVPPESGDEMWFVVFEFNSIGYVKDDEKNELDPNGILDSIKRGTEASNKERRKRGWATMDILGWHTPPRYDAVTNNLTWAIRGASEGSEVVNYSVRLLGRRGVMDVDLVLAPTHVAATLPDFESLLTGFEFTTGNRYAEWKPGDKVAAYGLTALVAGGAGAALAKSGVLAKLWKFIVFGALAVVAAIKKMLGFGGKKEAESAGTAAQ